MKTIIDILPKSLSGDPHANQDPKKVQFMTVENDPSKMDVNGEKCVLVPFPD